MPMRNLKSIYEKIDSYQSDVIFIQQALTRMPALAPENGGQGEAEKAGVIKKYLENLKPDLLEEICIPDARVACGYRPSLLARWTGRSSQKTIWIMTHMDVVPDGDASSWQTPPFEAVERDGKVYGRGTEDNQQGIVSSLLSVKALRELNLSPAYDVGLVIVADEENGSRYGIEAILKTRKDIFKKEDLILIPDSGDTEGVLIEVAEKSILWIRCETVGKQTHGSTPERGKNAHKAAAHFIVKMNDLYTLYPKNDPLFDPPISTFEPTKKEINVDNINTIPGRDVVYFDCRILPDYDLNEIMERIRMWADEVEQQFGVTISLSYPQSAVAPSPTSPDAPVVHALKKAIREVIGKEARTIGIGGGTVAAVFREAGLPAVCWCTLDDTLHGPDEYSVIANTLTDAKVFAHLFLQE